MSLDDKRSDGNLSVKQAARAPHFKEGDFVFGFEELNKLASGIAISHYFNFEFSYIVVCPSPWCEPLFFSPHG